MKMTNEFKSIYDQAEAGMKKVIDATKKDFSTLRTGRANTSILDRVTVEYYGSEVPINQVANISVPEARMILIQPWDKSILPQLEKAIQKADLGLNPSNDGSVIRLVIPQLTEERRKELVKIAKKEAEEKRVAVRNLRRDANDQLKKLEKDGIVSEDEYKKGLDEIQKLTDKYIEQIDRLLENKEAEILEV